VRVVKYFSRISWDEDKCYMLLMLSTKETLHTMYMSLCIYRILEKHEIKHVYPHCYDQKRVDEMFPDFVVFSRVS
jgi:hypothetical protein